MDDSVTKNTLAKTIFYETGIPAVIAEEILDSVFASIVAHAKLDGAVKIPKFGSFVVRKKKPRIGRNLNTGEEVVIKARNVVSFQASGQLKQVINENSKV